MKALIALLAIATTLAPTPKAVAVEWDWFVVSTPDVAGPIRVNEAGFKAPVPKNPLPKTMTVTQEGRISGIFEVIVTAKGTVEFEKVLAGSRPDVQKGAKAALNRWRLTPASLDGEPIRVRVRVFLEGG
jgi:TonB-like protein